MDNDFFHRNRDVARIDDDGNLSGTNPDLPPASNEPSTLKDAIAENAKGPKRVQGDSGSVEQHSLKDQIEAERFLQSKKAAQGKGFPVRLFKISPDGAS